MNAQDLNPIWDDSGKLRDGCTIQQAVNYLRSIGMADHTNITVNGVFYTLGQLSRTPEHPEIMEAVIKDLSPGYYGTHGFKI